MALEMIKALWKRTYMPMPITALDTERVAHQTHVVTWRTDGSNTSSHFDLSMIEGAPYLVCNSFNGTPGMARVCELISVLGTNATESSNVCVKDLLLASDMRGLGRRP